jgi:hypothetical protein
MAMPRLFQGEHHFSSHVLVLVCRRQREIPMFGFDFVSQVGTRMSVAGVPVGFRRINFKERGMGLRLIADIAEDKKFRLRADKDGVAQAGAFDVLLLHFLAMPLGSRL